MGPVGVPEMFLIFILALLLFGPKKLPELGRMLGKGLSEFRRAKNELKSTFETHMRELEKETQLDSNSNSNSTALDYSSRPYPYPYDEYGQEGSNNGYTSDLPGEPYQSSETEASEPAHTSPAPQQEHGTDQFHSDPVHSAAEQTQIAGTVSRSNGVRPVEPVSVPAEEDHRG
jgi:TatA/E family protein of Tat protein translocase